MPGRFKQVPQDSTEWDRTDTGHSSHTLTSTRVISTLTHVLNPLVISYRKYIYTGSYLCVLLESDSRPL